MWPRKGKVGIRFRLPPADVFGRLRQLYLGWAARIPPAYSPIRRRSNGSVSAAHRERARRTKLRAASDRLAPGRGADHTSGRESNMVTVRVARQIRPSSLAKKCAPRGWTRGSANLIRRGRGATCRESGPPDASTRKITISAASASPKWGMVHGTRVQLWRICEAAVN